jgi:phosphatidylglycerophosphate synthase
VSFPFPSLSNNIPTHTPTVWLAVIILGRDVGLAVSAIYYRWISLPPPKTFTRYWDFSLPSAEVRPTTISKYNTALQLGLMGMTTVAPVIPAIDLALPLGVMQYVFIYFPSSISFSLANSNNSKSLAIKINSLFQVRRRCDHHLERRKLRIQQRRRQDPRPFADQAND